MEIKTKYNIGDKVYFIHGNKITCNKIISIDISIYDRKNNGIPKIEYTIDFGFRTGKISDTLTIRPEEELYSTKEELIKSIVE